LIQRNLSGTDGVIVSKSILVLDLELGEFLSLVLNNNGVVPDGADTLSLSGETLSSVETDLELAVRVHLA